MIALSWRHATELGHDPAALIGLHDRRAGDEIGLVAVEIGFAWLEILVPTLCVPALALGVLDKYERAGAENVSLWKLWVLGQLHGAVDAVPGRGEISQHRRVRPLQAKDHSQRVGCVDAADRAEIHLPRRDHAGRRVDDPLIARLDTGRAQSRAVME